MRHLHRPLTEKLLRNVTPKRLTTQNFRVLLSPSSFSFQIHLSLFFLASPSLTSPHPPLSSQLPSVSANDANKT
ncbi:hypothetical protein E2C01_072291 [Portunus trituberculatus]|uniref:Uncharacterized protein n=1 Tax=Portunus trituberculatus TaxID=210409 RepID=A0A5B7IAT5_PORTR|nr:hypothetical protein [Portunus trituberculatus]